MSRSFSEYHENVDEYFQMNEPVRGKRKISTKVKSSVAAALPLSAGVIAAVVVVLIIRVICSPDLIGTSSAKFRISVFHASAGSDVCYAVFQQKERVSQADIPLLLQMPGVDSGKIQAGNQHLQVENLRPGTDYVIVFYEMQEDAPRLLTAYHFQTAAPDTPPGTEPPETQPVTEPTTEPATDPTTEPTEPTTEPTEPTTEPTEPTTEPTEPTTEPTEPTTEPTEPTTEPTEPTTEPTEPTTEPTELTTEPTEPTTEPTEPSTEPTEDPTEPSVPPTEPMDPNAPTGGEYLEIQEAARLDTWDGYELYLGTSMDMKDKTPDRAVFLVEGMDPQEAPFEFAEGMVKISGTCQVPAGGASITAVVYYTDENGQEQSVSSAPAVFLPGSVGTITLDEPTDAGGGVVTFTGTVDGIEDGEGSYAITVTLDVYRDDDGTLVETVEATVTRNGSTAAFFAEYPFTDEAGYYVMAHASCEWTVTGADWPLLFDSLDSEAVPVKPILG